MSGVADFPTCVLFSYVAGPGETTERATYWFSILERTQMAGYHRILLRFIGDREGQGQWQCEIHGSKVCEHASLAISELVSLRLVNDDAQASGPSEAQTGKPNSYVLRYMCS
jgi:hypothetical protein